MKSAVYFIPEEGIEGFKNLLFRIEIAKTAKRFGITPEQVWQELEKVRKENPQNKTVIVFSQSSKEAPVLLVETRNAYFERLLEQTNRTGVLTSALI